MKNKISKLLVEINKDIYEKEEVISLSVLSALAGESIFLLGSPGVAKSLISRRLKYIFKEASHFEYLMNKFSTPEEIFGPVSISKIQEDKYERKIEKYLPDSEVVFLDEIWKAGPSIQNSLLTVINEKVYRNGTQEDIIKLKSLISASNELPAKDEGLEALWDRFLVRYVVENIEDENNFFEMITSSTNADITIDETIQISDEEYNDIQDKSKTIYVPDEVKNTISVIRKYISKYNEQNKKDEEFTPIYTSDRRWKKIINILRTSAYLNGREKVDLMDCFLIVHMLWDEVEQIDILKEIVAKAIKEHGYSLKFDLDRYSDELDDFSKDIQSETKAIKYVTMKKKKEYNINNEIYYEIDIDSQDHYILKSDFNQLQDIKKDLIIYYNKDALHAEHYVVQKHKEIDKLYYRSHYNSDNFDYYKNECSFTLEDYEEEQLTTKAPHLAVKKVWNQKVENILKDIEKDKKTIDEYKKVELKTLKENLFVNNELSKVVEENLISLLGRLLRYESEVEKLKDSYENIN